jgi:hypothetical protein
MYVELWSENSVSNLLNQANIRELEEEVKLLKNLKHPNIVVSLCILIMLVISLILWLSDFEFLIVW